MFGDMLPLLKKLQESLPRFVCIFGKTIYLDDQSVLFAVPYICV